MSAIGRNTAFALVFCAGLASGLLIDAARASGEEASAHDQSYTQLALFAEALHAIRTQHLRPPDTDVLIEHAIQGMTQALDAHSAYLDEELLRVLQEDSSGAFDGIGVELIDAERGPTILRVFPSSPAEAQGLQPGDLLISLNEVPLQGAAIERVVLELRNSDARVVQLRVERGGHVFDVELERAHVHIVSVEVDALSPTRSWVKLRHFNDETAASLRAALRPTRGAAPEQVILDLRDNPGGLLEAAIESARLLLDDGTIVHVDDGTARGRRSWEARRGAAIYRGDLVVLINEHSASGAELLAAALRDNGRAPLIGAQSFGKGTIQAIVPLTGGSALKLSVAEYVSPQGHCIHGVGVSPDLQPPHVDDDGPTNDARPSARTHTCDSEAGIDPRSPILRTPSDAALTRASGDPALALALDILDAQTSSRRGAAKSAE